jgi:hypothetical protein
MEVKNACPFDNDRVGGDSLDDLCVRGLRLVEEGGILVEDAGQGTNPEFVCDSLGHPAKDGYLI